MRGGGQGRSGKILLCAPCAPLRALCVKNGIASNHRRSQFGTRSRTLANLGHPKTQAAELRYRNVMHNAKDCAQTQSSVSRCSLEKNFHHKATKCAKNIKTGP
jgi:hypothetical protein